MSEPEHVQEARRVIREWELRDGHNSYVECLEGGVRGYQAVCSDCDWQGPERLRGDEPMGSYESRAHKVNAKWDSRRHRAATRSDLEAALRKDGLNSV